MNKEDINKIKKMIMDLPDPYPKKMNKTITNDDDYIALVPDSHERTSVSWYLMGESFRATKERMIKAIEDLDYE